MSNEPRVDQGDGETVTAWTNDELERIGEANELELTAGRRSVTIWVVRVG
jgi:hypothetical protein